MTKPDWAERLQRSRKREYDKGWADCENRIVTLLEDEITSMETIDTGIGNNSGNMAIRITAIKVAIALIKGEQE